MSGLAFVTPRIVTSGLITNVHLNTFTENVMHVLTKLGATSVFAATLMTGAHAQLVPPSYLPDKGTSEVGVSATINFEPNNSYGVVGRYGYFLNRNLELGLDASYTKVKNGSSSDFWDAGVFGNFHFPTASPWLPYVGLFAGSAGGSGLDNSFSWGAQGGAKYFFNPNVAAFGELRWRDLQKGDNQTGLFFGLSIFFR
jgi:opacity protein-like surface antigen